MLTIHKEKIGKNVLIPHEEFEEIISLIRDKVDVEIIEPKVVKEKALLEMCGLGKEIWCNIDPVDYQRGERAGW